MKSASVEELRAEARRLIEAVKNTSDPEIKKEIAARALALSERAEAIERSIEDPTIIRANIERYRAMLASGIKDEGKQRIVEEMLSDAEALLDRLHKKTP
jgi:CRP-like cAMP-binding protein